MYSPSPKWHIYWVSPLPLWSIFQSYLRCCLLGSALGKQNLAGNAHFVHLSLQYIYMSESFCHVEEMNTTLQINYTFIKFKKYEKCRKFLFKDASWAAWYYWLRMYSQGNYYIPVLDFTVWMESLIWYWLVVDSIMLGTISLLLEPHEYSCLDPRTEEPGGL